MLRNILNVIGSVFKILWKITSLLIGKDFTDKIEGSLNDISKVFRGK